MVDSPELIAYRNSRPGKRMAAGAVIRDRQGRVLLVEPTYRDRWLVPGGVVEADESPRTACRREVAEELGLELPIGRMLVMEWQGPEPERTESLMFLFDGGVLDAGVISLAADELRSYAFVAPDDFDQFLADRLAKRLRAALAALAENRLVELEHGSLVTTRGPGL